jgi:hypothetical protein
VLKPVDAGELEVVIHKVVSSPARHADLEIASEDIEMVGEDDIFLSMSPVMQKVRAQAELLAHAEFGLGVLNSRILAEGVFPIPLVE